MTKRILLSLLVCVALFAFASAHPGRTDSSGGHYDRSTGEYHYHHGYPAHQHTNGVCPYDYDDKTGQNSGSSSSSVSSNSSSDYVSKEAVANAYKKAKENYDEGYSVGYSAATAKYRKQLICIAIAAGLALLLIRSLVLRHINNLQEQEKEIRERLKREIETSKKQEDKIKQLRNEIKNNQAEWVKLKHQLAQAKKAASPLPKPSPEPPEPTAPRPKKIASFAGWPPSVHDSDKQFRKFQKATDEPLDILRRTNTGAFIKGSTGEMYITTLKNCTCPDFEINERGKAPCKHIYFLAIKNGIPVGDIFEDYMKP